jgi:hypothetical protein
MTWFKRDKPQAESVPAYRPYSALEADAQLLTKIRSLCEVAAASAEVVGRRVADEETLKQEKHRFESAKRLSLELTKGIADEFYRDTALQLIVELCMTANDVTAASILVRGIHTGIIRERLLGEHPVAFY